MRTLVKAIAAVALALAFGSAGHAQSVGLPTVNGFWTQTACGTGPAPCFRQFGGCDQTAIITVAQGATTQIVALTTDQSIKVCAFLLTGDTLATVATFVSGTGANCVSSQVAASGAFRLQDEGNIPFGTPNGYVIQAPVSTALCLTAATGAVTGQLIYTKQ